MQSEKNTFTKKPFDKKKYRLQKYSNKYKVEKWEERRKKAVLREFYKELKKDKSLSAKPNVNSEYQNESKQLSSKVKGRNAFFEAKKEFLKKQNEKIKKKEEFLQKKAEREEKLKKYKERRNRTFKALSQKTRKGQPVMKDRMQLLFEKIQGSQK